MSGASKADLLKEAETIDFKPLWDFVLLEVLERTTTAGGLMLPSGAKIGGTKKGLVLKSGPGAYRDNGTLVPNPIKVGDYVYFMSHVVPFEVLIGTRKYLCMSGRDCVAIAESSE